MNGNKYSDTGDNMSSWVVWGYFRNYSLLFIISVTISIANVLDMSNAQVYGAWFEPMARYDDNGATIYLSYRVHRNCTARARQVGLFSCDKSTVIAQCLKIYIVLTRTHSKG